jgi:hypothetical protein
MSDTEKLALTGRLWALNLACQRLNVDEADYEELRKFVTADFRANALQWGDFKDWLKELLKAGTLRDKEEIAKTLGGSSKD